MFEIYGEEERIYYRRAHANQEHRLRPRRDPSLQVRRDNANRGNLDSTRIVQNHGNHDTRRKDTGSTVARESTVSQGSGLSRGSAIARVSRDARVSHDARGSSVA